MVRSGLFAAAAFAALFAAPGSHAQIITLGSGLGAECYQTINNPFASPKRAERLCSRALTEDVLNANGRAATYINRGIARMRQSKAEEALEDFGRAKAINPDMPDLYINEGAVLVHLGRYDDALTALQKAVETGTDNLHIAYLNLGLAREGLGDVEGAYFDIARARELAPDWKVAEYELARFKLTTDDPTIF